MDRVLESLKKYWGYSVFLPLQRQAIDNVLKQRDSIVVLPTGGGKSLCFQAPAVSLDGYIIVVSPLISLMKDQVDALTECGISAARIDSSLSFSAQQFAFSRLRQGTLKILYVAPERLVTEPFMQLMREMPPAFVAIDEAHCVSMWGHDFRPEYRQLGILKEAFPDMSVHAFTATATRQVRDDIAKQLRLFQPQILVGFFDRPNLVYKVEPRLGSGLHQICEIMDGHKGESGIVYCIRRKDVDEMCQWLSDRGYRVAPYHAGLEDNARKQNQDAFIGEQVDIIVATVAFGMGIDKSNVRFVIHAGMPKSLEHYQQESGRAGRDGLEAECSLLYSGADYQIWKHFSKDLESAPQKIALGKLSAMYDYCVGVDCRRKAILNYFGQTLQKENCYACDICLGEMQEIPESTIVAQKILSCVVRLKEFYGAEHTAMVLLGSKDHRILDAGHNELSTYGLLREEPHAHVRMWIDQLGAQGHLQKDSETGVLRVTAKGWRVLRSKEQARLFIAAPPPVEESPLPPAPEEIGKSRKGSVPAEESWAGVDKGLFEHLRELRHRVGEEKGIPPHVVFSDIALRDMARKRPATPAEFRSIKGVGERKSLEYSERFLKSICEYCAAHSLALSLFEPGEQKDPDNYQSAAEAQAELLFNEGKSIAEVALAIGRAQTTVVEYLAAHIQRRGIKDVSPWVDAQILKGVQEAIIQHGVDRLRPIYDHLNGQVSYEQIRICIACICNGSQS